MPYFWLGVNITVFTAGLLFFKEATVVAGEVPENFSELTGWFVKLLSNPYTLPAVFFAVLSFLSYVIAVSRLKLSYVYPLSQAAQLVLVAILSLLLFEEEITWLSWVGIVAICIGISLMSMPRNISERKP